MKEIEIIVRKITNKGEKTLYKCKTKEKYLSNLLANLFWFESDIIKLVKKVLKRDNKWEVDYTSIGQKNEKVERFDKILTVRYC